MNSLIYSRCLVHCTVSAIHNLSQGVVSTPRFDDCPPHRRSELARARARHRSHHAGDNTQRKGRMNFSTVPKSEIEVLSQEISDEFGFYRIRAGQRVHYVTITASVFDDDTMCRPNLLIPQLPDFPDKKWTKMEVMRKPDGSLVSEISYGPLPSAHTKWYSKIVDVVSLEKVKQQWSSVHEVQPFARLHVSTGKSLESSMRPTHIQ